MSEQSNVSVVLPCSAGQFNDFISGLLGQPQEIDGGEFGSFCVDKDKVIQGYHLVTQRIIQQNGTNPVAFNIRIVYDDGTSIKLNSLADFESFYEPKPVASTECHLTFVYLIQFPTTSAPEKQEIIISYVSSNESKSRRRNLAVFAEPGMSILARGYIGYTIKYTARTWGADIEGLLKNYISHQMDNEHWFRKFIRKNSGKFALAIASLIFVLFYYGQSVILDKVTMSYLSQFKDIFGNSVSVADKLDMIIKMLAYDSSQKITIISDRIIIGAAFLSIILLVYLESKAEGRKPSFVVLTKRSEDVKKDMLIKYQRNWWKLWGAMLVSITLGLVTSFAYDLYAKEIMREALLEAKSQIEVKLPSK